MIPKNAMLGKTSQQEAIQTNESFAKTVNNTLQLAQTPSMTPSHVVQTGNTFIEKKKSTGMPYPIKTGVLGDSDQALNRTSPTGIPFSTKMTNLTKGLNKVTGSPDHKSSKSKSRSPPMQDHKVRIGSKKFKSPIFETSSTTPKNISVLTIQKGSQEMIVKEHDSLDNNTETAERLSHLYNQARANQEADTTAPATALNRDSGQQYFKSLTQSPSGHSRPVKSSRGNL